MRWVIVEVHVMIAGKPRELSKCRKQIYYRNNPQREEARKCYHTMRPFTGKLVKAKKESYSPICFPSVLCKIHPHHPPPTQIVNSDNGLTLAFNNSPTEMTGDKSMPLDTIISTTCSRNYNSAYSAVSEAAFFILSCLIFSSVFP